MAPSLLANRAFTGGLALVVVFFAGLTGLTGLMLVTAVYLQTALGFTALAAGLTGSRCRSGS